MKKASIFVLIALFFLIGILSAFLGIKTTFIFLTLFVVGILILSNYQIITCFLVLYPFIDFALRNFMPSFASIWDELLFICMFLIWGYKSIVYRKQELVKQTPLDLPVILFFIAIFIVFILNSPDYKISLEGFRAIVQYILWYFVVLQLLKDEKAAKALCLIFIFTVGLMAIHGVYQFIIGVEMPSNWVDSKEAGVRTRVFSILTSPNILGSLMTLAIPITVSFFFNSKELIKKLIFAFLALMMVGTLVFTFSRGAWIGFAAAVFIYVILKDKRLLIPVLIMGILVIIFIPGVGNRITYMLSPEYIESSLRGGRLIRWGTGLKILEGTPLLGVGLGHFGGAVAMNNELSYLVGTEYMPTYYMDNYYLKIGVEAGIFGLIAFVALMYQIVLNGFRTIFISKNKEQKEISIGLLSGIFGVIVHNFFENVFEVPMMTSCFWLLVAIMMHFYYINYNQNKSLET